MGVGGASERPASLPLTLCVNTINFILLKLQPFCDPEAALCSQELPTAIPVSAVPSLLTHSSKVPLLVAAGAQRGVDHKETTGAHERGLSLRGCGSQQAAWRKGPWSCQAGLAGRGGRRQMGPRACLALWNALSLAALLSPTAPAHTSSFPEPDQWAGRSLEPAARSNRTNRTP